MTLKQIDDIFKATVTADVFFNSYYYGWRSDMNIAISDDGSDNVFPRVFVAASPSGDFDSISKNSTIKYRVIFEMLQNYENDNSELLEYWSTLKDNGERFLMSLNSSLKSLNMGLQNNINFDSDSNIGDSRIVALWFDIGIIHKVKC